eukprot:gb/GECG01004361.1/.p1 GENE.gb/GECG01004361.1/~~gb/GECG01004361.1/.p1  ORF type:complete len:126 (+),score=5.92 gb/GECG01004361.1/:1-378(+)
MGHCPYCFPGKEYHVTMLRTPMKSRFWLGTKLRCLVWWTVIYFLVVQQGGVPKALRTTKGFVLSSQSLCTLFLVAAEDDSSDGGMWMLAISRIRENFGYRCQQSVLGILPNSPSSSAGLSTVSKT